MMLSKLKTVEELPASESVKVLEDPIEFEEENKEMSVQSDF